MCPELTAADERVDRLVRALCDADMADPAWAAAIFIYAETEVAGDEFLAHLARGASEFHPDLSCLDPEFAPVFAQALRVKWERAGRPLPSSWSAEERAAFQRDLADEQERYEEARRLDWRVVDVPEGPDELFLRWLLAGCNPPVMLDLVAEKGLDAVLDMATGRALEGKWASDLLPRRGATISVRRPQTRSRPRRARRRARATVKVRSPDDDSDPELDRAAGGGR